MSHLLDLATAALAIGARLGAGRRVVARGPRPAVPVELYDFEACPFCRRVREVLAALDVDAVVYPCPKGGDRFRPRAIAAGGKAQFPFLVDPNTGRALHESTEIARYLAATYGDGALPTALRPGPLAPVSLALSWLPRLHRGMKARPSRPPARPLELWGHEASPASRLVRERLCELELPYRLRSAAHGTAARAALVARTGSGRLPHLHDADSGRWISGGRAIIDHLERTYAVAP